jgi:hypothetical protein
MSLKRVGFFREVRGILGDDVRDMPSIHDAIHSVGHPDEERIIGYLKAGVCLWAAGCCMPDGLNPSNYVRGAPDYLTDGVWLWPGELAYYVTEYHIELPSEFVADMRQNGWVVPALSQALIRALCDEIFPDAGGPSEGA